MGIVGGFVARGLGYAVLFGVLGGLGGAFFDALLRTHVAMLYGAAGGAAFGLLSALPVAVAVSARRGKARKAQAAREAEPKRPQRQLLTRDQAISDKSKSLAVAEENRKTVPIPLADETRKSDAATTETSQAPESAAKAKDEELPRIPLAGEDEPPEGASQADSGEQFSSYAEQLRCPYCKHKAVCDTWPEYGDLVPFYFQKAPGEHQIEIECSGCGNTWYVVWEEDPHKAPF